MNDLNPWSHAQPCKRAPHGRAPASAPGSPEHAWQSSRASQPRHAASRCSSSRSHREPRPRRPELDIGARIGAAGPKRFLRPGRRGLRGFVMPQSSTATLSRRTGARREFALWGGEAAVVVVDRSRLSTPMRAVRRTVESFDRACSSFREDSELALLNASAGEPVVISSLLLTAVRVACGPPGRRTARSTRRSGRRWSPTAAPPGRYEDDHSANRAASAATRIVKLDEASSSVRCRAGCVWISAQPAKRSPPTCRRGGHVRRRLRRARRAVRRLAVAGEPPAGGWRVRVTDDHRWATAPARP